MAAKALAVERMREGVAHSRGASGTPAMRRLAWFPWPAVPDTRDGRCLRRWAGCVRVGSVVIRVLTLGRRHN